MRRNIRVIVSKRLPGDSILVTWKNWSIAPNPEAEYPNVLISGTPVNIHLDPEGFATVCTPLEELRKPSSFTLWLDGLIPKPKKHEDYEITWREIK